MGLKQKNSNVQIDCYHNVGPKIEFYIEDIVKGVSDKLKCSSVLAKVSREVADLNRKIDDKNREIILGYRDTLKKNLDKTQGSYLLIIIHGMKNRERKDIEIGTSGGKLCSAEIGKWFISKMKKEFSEFKIVVDDEFCGNEILEEHRKILGKRLNIFQIELSYDLRKSFRQEVVLGLSNILKEFKF